MAQSPERDDNDLPASAGAERASVGQAAAQAPPLAAHDLAHLVVEGLFALVFPDPNARLRLGLKAISRGRQEMPAWYLWTNARLGVCELALLSSAAAGCADGAVFALRYFPDPREAVFTRFAPVEQQARLSPLFDASGTPGADSAGDIDPSLFHIGTLVIVPQGAHHIRLRLDAQDRWIEQARAGDGWAVRRDVPGLRLALAVLDPLVCGLSYLGRQSPSLVRAWRRPGVVWDVEASGDARSRADADAWAWEIDLQGLLVPGRAGLAPPPLSRSLEHPLFEHADEIPPHYAPWPINSHWWQSAGWQFDPVGDFCSHCATEEHPHAAHIHPAISRSDDDEH